MLFPRRMATPMLDWMQFELDEIAFYEAIFQAGNPERLEELWRLDAAGTTAPFGVAPSVQWDVWDTSCDFERDDKVPVGTPIVHHVAGTAHALQPCTMGWPIPEQGDEGKRLGLEQAITRSVEAYATANNVCPPDQVNIASHVLRLVGALDLGANVPPGVVLTPWLDDPEGIVGLVPQELVVGPLSRDEVFDVPSNTTQVLDEFRFVFTFTFPGLAANENTGIPTP